MQLLVSFKVQTPHTCSNKSWKDPALSELHYILLLPELLQDGHAAWPGCRRGGIPGVVTVPATVQNTTILIIKICLKINSVSSTAMKLKTGSRTLSKCFMAEHRSEGLSSSRSRKKASVRWQKRDPGNEVVPCHCLCWLRFSLTYIPYNGYC